MENCWSGKSQKSWYIYNIILKFSVSFFPQDHEIEKLFDFNSLVAHLTITLISIVTKHTHLVSLTPLQGMCPFLSASMCVLLIFVFWVSSLLPQSIQVLLFYLLPTKCLTQILTQPINCLKYVNTCLVLILGVPAVLVPLKYLTKVLNFSLNCLTILFAPEADFC